MEKRDGLSSSAGELRYCFFDSIDSTNSEARRQAEAGRSAPALIIADTQTGGRGRMGRSFYSPEKSGLYMSVLLDAKADFSDNVRMTSAAAVGVSNAIFELFSIEVGIKWVNDLYFNGKKVCGILCESFTANGKRFSVIGVGINLSTESFPDEIKNVAASLGVDHLKKEELGRRIAENILWLSENIGDKRIMDSYRKKSLVIGKEISFCENGIWKNAVAESVDDLGALHAFDAEGNKYILSSGEISLKINTKQEKI